MYIYFVGYVRYLTLLYQLQKFLTPSEVKEYLCGGGERLGEETVLQYFQTPLLPSSGQ
jgi:hypothetical protein